MQLYSSVARRLRLGGKVALSWRVLGFSIACSLVPCAGQPATTGTINGRVRNRQTGAFLEGPFVEVIGWGAQAVTGRDGSFSISQVPIGSQQVRIFYTGTEPRTESVDVQAARSADLNVVLAPSDVHLLSG